MEDLGITIDLLATTGGGDMRFRSDPNTVPNGMLYDCRKSLVHHWAEARGVLQEALIPHPIQSIS